jgi:hypothetical protein
MGKTACLQRQSFNAAQANFQPPVEAKIRTYAKKGKEKAIDGGWPKNFCKFCLFVLQRPNLRWDRFLFLTRFCCLMRDVFLTTKRLLKRLFRGIAIQGRGGC